MSDPPYQPQGNPEILAKAVDELGLSERTLAAIKAGGIASVGDLAAKRLSQMYRIQNIGKRNCTELAAKLAQLGLAFREEAPVPQEAADRQINRNVKEDRRSVEAPEGQNARSGKQESRPADRQASGRKPDAQKSSPTLGQPRGRRERDRRKNQTSEPPLSKEQMERRNQIRQMLNVNKGLNDSLTRQYAGLTIEEILNGKRERPTAEKEEKQALTADSIVKFCRKGKWGYKDWKGNVVISPVFDEAYTFSEGFAWVEKDGKLGLIDRGGNLVLDYRYDTATSFSQGLASVTLDEKSGYIDPEGNTIVDFVYEIATPFSDGRAVVYADGRWGVLNRETLKIFWR